MQESLVLLPSHILQGVYIYVYIYIYTYVYTYIHNFFWAIRSIPHPSSHHRLWKVETDIVARFAKKRQALFGCSVVIYPGTASLEEACLDMFGWLLRQYASNFCASIH